MEPVQRQRMLLMPPVQLPMLRRVRVMLQLQRHPPA
jgi:hypothetical protein